MASSHALPLQKKTYTLFYERLVTYVLALQLRKSKEKYLDTFLWFRKAILHSVNKVFIK